MSNNPTNLPHMNGVSKFFKVLVELPYASFLLVWIFTTAVCIPVSLFFIIPSGWQTILPAVYATIVFVVIGVPSTFDDVEYVLTNVAKTEKRYEIPSEQRSSKLWIYLYYIVYHKAYGTWKFFLRLGVLGAIGYVGWTYVLPMTQFHTIPVVTVIFSPVCMGFILTAWLTYKDHLNLRGF